MKAAVENLDHFGDHMSPVDVDIADALFHARIPKKWMKKAGYNALPPSSTIVNWLADLSLRVAHFERLLALVIPL